MQLGFTDVPPGSLLAFYGPSNPDYVVALDPTSGTVIASLQLAGNYDTTAGVYDPVTGDLFVINRNVSHEPDHARSIRSMGRSESHLHVQRAVQRRRRRAGARSVR